MKASLRTRMSSQDAHYGGSLVDGACILALFGDVATELLIRIDGDEGLFRAYETVDFIVPVYAGDYIEVTAELIAIGKSSRKMAFTAYKVIAPLTASEALAPSSAQVLSEPIVVARAIGTCVVPVDLQRLSNQFPPLVITAAITGAEITREHTPYLPITPKEVGQEAKNCADAGASIIHLHARNTDGTPTQSKERFAEYITAIRDQTDIIIQVSTGGAIGMSIEERCQPLELTGNTKPDMATLNVATMNFGNDIFANKVADVIDIAKQINKIGIATEVEMYDSGHINAAQKLIQENLLSGLLHCQFVVGVAGGIDADHDTVDGLLNRLNTKILSPKTCSLAGIGRHQMSVASIAIKRGCNVRVGLEDNIYLKKGVLAKGSAELVQCVHKQASDFGRKISSIQETKEHFSI